MIPALPADTRDGTFAAIERACIRGGSADTGDWRGALAARRRVASGTAVEELARQFVASEEAGDFVAIARACVALGGDVGGGTALFGRASVWLHRDDRARLRGLGRAALERGVSSLTWRQADEIARIASGGNLVIDLEPRHADLAAPRAAARSSSDVEPRNADLERQIEASFEANSPDDAAFLVLAYWLQGHGHPRGELIARQLGGATAAAVDAYVEIHAEALLGALAEAPLADTREPAFVWRRGFLDRARLSLANYDVALGELLATLFVHPSARFLRELVIGHAGSQAGEGLDSVIALIASDAPATLRALHLGAFDLGDMSMSTSDIGSLAPLWSAPRLAGLERLVAQGVEIELGEIDAPALGHLEIRTTALARDACTALAAARCPKLHTLIVWCSAMDEDGYARDDGPTRDDLAALVASIAARALPLRTLGLVNATDTDALVAPILRAPWAAELETLDLSRGTLGDRGAALLVEGRTRLPRLTRLDVTASFLSAAAVARLVDAFPEVVADDLRPTDDDRFPAVLE